MALLEQVLDTQLHAAGILELAEQGILVAEIGVAEVQLPIELRRTAAGILDSGKSDGRETVGIALADLGRESTFGLKRVAGVSRRDGYALGRAGYGDDLKFRRDSRFSTWLYRVAVNAALKARGRRRRNPEQPLEEIAHLFPGKEDNEPAFEGNEVVNRLLRPLPEPLRGATTSPCRRGTSPGECESATCATRTDSCSA